jgi:hypothetical protein
VATSHVAYAQERRSTRIDQTIVLTVRGMDAFQARYVEKVPTLTLSYHGCKYRSKREPTLGNLVLLELVGSNRGILDLTQARVKWLKETMIGKERVWDVAVELETPGNFWDVASPPEDWVPASGYKTMGRSKSGQELQVVPRSEQQVGPVPNQVSAQTVSEPVPTSLAPFLSGLNEHVQKLVSETVTAVVVKENGRLIERFRVQLHDEMTKTLERVVGRSKEELIRRALSELTEALEFSARNTQEQCINKLEDGLKNASIRMTAQAAQVNERISGVADIAVERLKSTTDQFSREMSDDFRVRSLNICEQAVDFLQQSMQQFTDQIHQRSVELKNQFESNLNERLARADCELNQKSTAVFDQSQLALVKLSETCQETVQAELKALTTSAVEHLANTLNQQASEISNQGMSQLQVSTRRYLDSISGSIAELSTKIA